MSIDLRRLDDRFVPVLARRTRAAAARVRSVRDAVAEKMPRRPTRPVEEVRTGPGGPIVWLRTVDDRWARRGPLALLRELPQVGGLLLAVLVLVNGAVVMQRSEPRSELVAEDPLGSSSDDPGELVDPEQTLIGPEIGDDVSEYVQKADRRLQDRWVEEPDERSFAVVSFDRYLTPTELAAVLEDVGAFRVYFRVPAPGLQTEVEETPIKRLVPDLLAAYRRVATQRRADVPPLLEMARTTEDPEFKSFYEATAKAYQEEIEALTSACACAFGIVTVASNDTLRQLRARPDVRVVDLGPSGATFDQLTYRALLPEERVTVTGGNEAPAELPAG